MQLAADSEFSLHGGQRVQANHNPGVDYGMDLSDRVQGVRTVKMEECCGRYLPVFQRLSPRIKWLAAYKRLKEERRLALAMVNHHRLGAESEFHMLGMDMLLTISQFLH